MKNKQQMQIDGDTGELYQPRDESEKANRKWKHSKVSEVTRDDGLNPEDIDCFGS